MRDKLTPRYGIGCKRPSFSNEYLPTFNRPNVELETTSIETIAPDAIRTADGTEHEVDVLVLATGFQVFDSGSRQVFFSNDCAGANSYYFDSRGDAPFRSATTLEVPGTALTSTSTTTASAVTCPRSASRSCRRCLPRRRPSGSRWSPISR